ncbi:hypothetical protein CK203_033283 [Vitis vinifera]|uniref:Uncharacterized protein n=1 Tax=Vitis vinifera TaxID=29760 RepID=A0A438HBV1_VITVI|nr:hypothetical protein CK203_033283 [Vitis vinifera]
MLGIENSVDRVHRDLVLGRFYYNFLWEIKDARVMTWILSSVEPHLVLNLRPYKTAAAMWNYLHTVYNQDNFARRFQLDSLCCPSSACNQQARSILDEATTRL